MGKLDAPDESDLLRVDPGWLADIDTLIETHWPYRTHKQLPEAGGTLDQDPALMQSLKWLDWQIEWQKINEKKPTALLDFDEFQKKRRDAHNNRG
jgi:hypothetical protein